MSGVKMPVHFADRVRQRIGPDVHPRRLFDELRAAIQAGDDRIVELVARAKGVACWRFRVGSGVFFAVVAHPEIVPLTVYPPGFTFRRGKGAPIRLEAA